jgi:hypothetical protein
MKYTRERFTDDEVEQIESLGKIVCYVFDITEEQLRSKSRKQPLPDARKLLASYASSNISSPRYLGYDAIGYNRLSLTSYYLDCDHSSVNHLVNSSAELYKTDKSFRERYDTMVTVINDNNIEALLEAKKTGIADLTWRDVRENFKVSNVVRYSLAPQEVIDGISELYIKGYDSVLISNEYTTLPTFIKHVAEKLKLVKKNRLSISHKYKLIAGRMKTKTYSAQTNELSKTINY